MLRTAAREGFLKTLSGVDLIVGARTGPLNLLLYSVFRIGDATSEVSWKSYELIAHHRDVAWTIPLSLGDSLHGFPVLGTDLDYFRHYRFAGDRALIFAAGGPFRDLYDAVLGADVAQGLRKRVGDSIIISHGLGAVSFVQHKDKPFHVVGILARTGTPVDRTVHVSLQGISAMHIDWRRGYEAPPGQRVSAEQARHMDLTPDGVTAFLVHMRVRPSRRSRCSARSTRIARRRCSRSCPGWRSSSSGVSSASRTPRLRSSRHSSWSRAFSVCSPP